jgi:hypothetical protein
MLVLIESKGSFSARRLIVVKLAKPCDYYPSLAVNVSHQFDLSIPLWQVKSIEADRVDSDKVGTTLVSEAT